jgi:predicted transcriptional regulator
MTIKKTGQSKRAVNPQDQSSRHDKKAIRAWQMEHIREGLRQADAGEFATEAEMKSTFSRGRK